MPEASTSELSASNRQRDGRKAQHHHFVGAFYHTHDAAITDASLATPLKPAHRSWRHRIYRLGSTESLVIKEEV